MHQQKISSLPEIYIRSTDGNVQVSLTFSTSKEFSTIPDIVEFREYRNVRDIGDQ